MELWVAAHWTDDARGWECQGVFSSKEKALAVCAQLGDCAVRFELDENCTEKTKFLVCTQENPEGTWG